MTRLQRLKLLDFALQAIATQQHLIFDLMSARAASEHLLSVVHPEDHAVYQKALDQGNHDAYQVRRATMSEIEAKVAEVQALIQKFSQKSS